MNTTALFPPLTNVMVRAVNRAAKSLVRDFGEVENLQVSRKGPADFVSNADLRSQSILREELSKARPNFGFLMEENDGAADTSGREEIWIADPLDGTTNFLHGLPHWCISVAASRNGEVIAGVTYNPITDEMFWAEKGHGAWLNNKRIRVSARRDLSECVVSTGFPFRGSKNPVEPFLEQMKTLMAQVAGIRRCGAAALDLAFVAAGRYDGYWESGISPWDIAAGVIIVREAGGIVKPLKAGENILNGSGIIATNLEIENKLRTAVGILG